MSVVKTRKRKSFAGNIGWTRYDYAVELQQHAESMVALSQCMSAATPNVNPDMWRAALDQARRVLDALDARQCEIAREPALVVLEAKVNTAALAWGSAYLSHRGLDKAVSNLLMACAALTAARRERKAARG